MKELTGKFSKKKESEEDFEVDMLDEEQEFELEDEENEQTENLNEPLGPENPGIRPEDATGEFQVSQDATQDIDTSGLIEDEIEFDEVEEPEPSEVRMAPEEVLEFEEKEEEEDEGELSKAEQIKTQLAKHLPFLAGMLGSKKPKVSIAKEEKHELPRNIRSEGELGEEENQKSKLEIFVEEKMPSLAPLVAKLSKKKGDGENGGYFGKEGQGEEEKPKRKIKVIHIVIIALLAFFALYEEEPEVPAPVAKPIPKYKKQVKPPKDKTPVVAEQPVEQPVVDQPKAEQPKVEEPAAELPKATEEELNNIFDDETIAAQEPAKTEETPETTPEEPEAIEEPAQEVEPETPSEPSIETEVPTGVVEQPAAEEPTVSQPVIEEPVVEEPEVVAEPKVDATPSEKASDRLELDDKVIDQVVEAGGGEEITEAILKQLEKTARKRRDETIGEQAVEPTEAPNYLDIGAGLVYNCAGRHWACVSEKSFKQCGKNYAWIVKEGKSIECYPSELYKSDMDCASMQQYKIDMAAETKFCN